MKLFKPKKQDVSTMYRSACAMVAEMEASHARLTAFMAGAKAKADAVTKLLDDLQEGAAQMQRALVTARENVNKMRDAIMEGK